MISDITLGQYFPQKSPLHATDPRLKICLLVYAIVLLFAVGTSPPWRWRWFTSAWAWPFPKSPVSSTGRA